MPDDNPNMDTLAELADAIDRAKSVPPMLSSTKALHGHLLGGAGALEAVITALALNERRLPPNSHCTAPDPACAVPLVPAGGIEIAALRAAISSSFAFGGTNSALLFTRA